MGNAKYLRGRRFEYKVQDTLKKSGFSTTRSASSKGLWDVTGVAADVTLLVQVKSTESKTGRWRDSNVAAFEKLPVPPYTRKEVWVYRLGVGKPEIYVLGDTQNEPVNST